MIKDAEDLAPAPTAGPSPVAETFDYMSSRELGQTVLGGSVVGYFEFSPDFRLGKPSIASMALAAKIVRVFRSFAQIVTAERSSSCGMSCSSFGDRR